MSLRQGRTLLTGSPTQRRRLALLALLAVGGENGVSRDKILGMLWPEADTSKARHALNQILFAERHDLGGANLFEGRDMVRLNPDFIESDVGLLDRALAVSDLSSAVDLYRGHFLEGFFLPGSPDFEMWARWQRIHFMNRVSDALENAARSSQAAGDLDTAVKWSRHAVEIDGLEADRAMRLAQRLELAGSISGALRVLQECQARIRSELDVAGDPAIARRIIEIKRSLQ